MSLEQWEAKVQDDYNFLVCCNAIIVDKAFKEWDGESPLIVNGRNVDERAVVNCLVDLGFEVII